MRDVAGALRPRAQFKRNRKRRPTPGLFVVAALAGCCCVVAGAEEQVVPQTPAIEVTASPPGRAYYTPAATTATKTDTSLMDTPASIQVITQQILQDQKATTLDQALVNVSGVRSSNIGWAETIYLRGFSTSTYFRDGFRIDDPSGLGGLLTLANVESIEVLKGPGSILYGRVEPGGVVNFVTKQPLASAFESVEVSAGSWNHFIVTVDATGPADDRKSVLYRVIVSYDAGKSWVDNVKDERIFIAPSLEWRIDGRTRVSLEASYLRDRSTLYQQAVVPYDTTTHQYQWGPKSANPAPYYFDPDTTFVGVNWSHDLNDDWTLKQKISHNQVDFSTPLNLSTAFGPLELDSNTWTVGLNTAQLSGKTISDGTVIDLTGHFQTGSVKHTLLFGGDYYRLEADYDSRYSNPAGPFVYVPLFSSNVPSTAGIPLDPDTYYSTKTTTTSYGIYLQDQVRLPGGFDVLAGLRYQDVRSSGETNIGANLGGSGGPAPSTPSHDSAVTPRLGVLWRAKDLSLYGSYAENFGATNASLGTDWQGQALKPESADQYEVGAKADLLGGKANLSLALFDLTKNNVAANALAHPNGTGGFYPTTVGKIASRGFELTLQGELLPGWDALAAYTHDHVFVKEGTQTYPQGSAMPFVPEDMFRLFTTYRLKGDGWSAWRIGAGLTWQGSAPGIYLDPDTGLTDTTTIRSPSYTVVDAMASYDFKAWGRRTTLQLNVRNLFNKSYYTDAFMYVAPWGYVTYGAPRSASASLRMEF